MHAIKILIIADISYSSHKFKQNCETKDMHDYRINKLLKSVGLKFVLFLCHRMFILYGAAVDPYKRGLVTSHSMQSYLFKCL